MDEERYVKEKEIYNLLTDETKKSGNYRLMRDNEIPSWFIETVPICLFSLKMWTSIKNTAEGIE